MRNLSSFLLACVLWTVTAAPAGAITYIVNSSSDEAGSNVGNGQCETAPGNGVCTLARAFLETSRLFDWYGPPADVTIVLAIPGGRVQMSSLVRIAGRGSLTILGAGPDQTIVEAAPHSPLQWNGWEWRGADATNSPPRSG